MKPSASNKSQNVDQQTAQENVKNMRKSLHVLQHAAGDKENLVGGGRMGRSNDNLKNKEAENNLIIEQSVDQTLAKTEKQKKLSSKSVQTEKEKIKIDVSDLTTKGEPSENYWKILAERRRVALDETLQENRHLHEKVEILEEENRVLKEMLEDSKSLVEVLKEMLDEGDDDDSPDHEQSIVSM